MKEHNVKTLTEPCMTVKPAPMPADAILQNAIERIDYLNHRLELLNKDRENLSRAVEEMLQERDMLCMARDALAPKPIIGNIPTFQIGAASKGY